MINTVYFYRKPIISSFFLFFLVAMLFIRDAKAHSSSVQAMHSQKAIILIHGLMRTPASMFFLGSFLKKQNYKVYAYDYPSAKNTIHEHGVFLNQYLKKFIKEHPNTKIYLITHSLGGIIARDALAQLPTEQLDSIGGLIMLAPPNQGSALAKFSTKLFPIVSYFVRPLTELSCEKNSYVHQVPVPNVKIGIIAGRYDAKVPPNSARLEGYAEPVLVNSTHTFIMNNSQTKLFIKHFLETGSFN